MAKKTTRECVNSLNDLLIMAFRRWDQQCHSLETHTQIFLQCEHGHGNKLDFTGNVYAIKCTPMATVLLCSNKDIQYSTLAYLDWFLLSHRQDSKADEVSSYKLGRDAFIAKQISSLLQLR